LARAMPGRVAMNENTQEVTLTIYISSVFLNSNYRYKLNILTKFIFGTGNLVGIQRYVDKKSDLFMGIRECIFG
jgi:hypothetical protein